MVPYIVKKIRDADAEHEDSPDPTVYSVYVMGYLWFIVPTIISMAGPARIWKQFRCLEVGAISRRYIIRIYGPVIFTDRLDPSRVHMCSNSYVLRTHIMK